MTDSRLLLKQFTGTDFTDQQREAGPDHPSQITRSQNRNLCCRAHPFSSIELGKGIV